MIKSTFLSRHIDRTHAAQLERARIAGYTTGYKEGAQDGAGMLPPELIEAFWVWHDAKENGTQEDVRTGRECVFSLLEGMIVEEKA